MTKEKQSKQSFRKSLRIFRFLLPYRWTFIFGLIILISSSVLLMGFPALLGKLVDAVDHPSNNEINKFALVLIGIFLSISILSFLRIYTFNYVAQKALADLRKKTYQHLLASPMNFFTSRRVGELSSRVANDISLLQETFTTTLAELIRQMITIPFGIFFLLFISFRLTIFMLAVIPVVAIIGMFFGKFIKRLSKEAQDSIADSNTVLDETLHAIISVKAFANEFLEVRRYNRSIENAVHASLKGASWRGFFIALVMFVAGSAIVGIIWYGLHLVQLNIKDSSNSSAITIGELVSFAIYAAILGATFGGMAELISQLQKAIGASESLLDLLEEEEEAISFNEVVNIPLEGRLEFEKVFFAYPSRRDIEVIKNIDFTINKGERVAIVGPSGSGKSTIASLLFRFYEPSSGTIKIDGKNLSDYPLSEIRNKMAIVPQEVLLFGGTIRENIEYGKPGATDAEILKAAKQANALEFIEQFPEKMETRVGDRGIQLSGGQKQRIAIARAILKDPAILILDEATSALDSKSEQMVQEALDRLMLGRTSVVIAHRLSTIKKADNILVIDKGEILETGTHEELMLKEKGIYRKLNTLQSA